MGAPHEAETGAHTQHGIVWSSEDSFVEEVLACAFMGSNDPTQVSKQAPSPDEPSSLAA